MTGTQSLLIGGGSAQRAAHDRWKAASINPLINRSNVIPAARHRADDCFEPVCGVTLEMFAQIARAVAAGDDDSAHGTDLARHCGIPADDWLLASKVWNSRIATFPAVAEHLMALFRPADQADWVAS